MARKVPRTDIKVPETDIKVPGTVRMVTLTDIN